MMLRDIDLNSSTTSWEHQVDSCNAQLHKCESDIQEQGIFSFHNSCSRSADDPASPDVMQFPSPHCSSWGKRGVGRRRNGKSDGCDGSEPWLTMQNYLEDILTVQSKLQASISAQTAEVEKRVGALIEDAIYKLEDRLESRYHGHSNRRASSSSTHSDELPTPPPARNRVKLSAMRRRTIKSKLSEILQGSQLPQGFADASDEQVGPSNDIPFQRVSIFQEAPSLGLTSDESFADRRRSTQLSEHYDSNAPDGGSCLLKQNCFKTRLSLYSPDEEESVRATSSDAKALQYMKNPAPWLLLKENRNSDGRHAIENFHTQRCKSFPLHPDSTIRMYLEITSMLVLLLDSILIPYVLAWDVRATGWLEVLTWCTLLFWTVDLCMNFLTAFHAEDKLITEYAEIAKAYVKSWFCIDLFVVAVDWVSMVLDYLVVEEEESSGSEESLFRIIRLLKLSRLSRVAVMMNKGTVQDIGDRLSNIMLMYGFKDKAKVVGQLLKILLLILWINHLGCCMWYAVAKSTANSSEGPSWFEQLWPVLETDLGNSEAQYVYLQGFYWSISTMSSLSSLVHPTSAGEVVFVSIFTLFSFLFASTVVSSLAALILDFQIQNQEQTEKIRVFRRFLCQHNVDPSLAMRMQQHVRVRLLCDRWIAEKDVSVLKLLSISMRAKLRRSMYAEHIKNQDFFRACDCFSDTFIRDLCFSALHLEWPQPGVELFAQGTDSQHCYYVMSGSFTYASAQTTVLDSNEDVVLGAPIRSRLSLMDNAIPVLAGSWICQLALWIETKHSGWLEAVTASEVIAINGKSFISVLNSRPTLKELARHYTTSLCGAIANEVFMAEEMSDLELPVPSALIAMTMPQRFRIMMSYPAICELRQQNTGFLSTDNKYVKELMQDIQNGSCDLICEPGIGIKRVVSVVALRVFRERDNALLYELWKSGGHQVSPNLPAVKAKGGETPGAACNRLLEDKLSPLGNSILIRSRTRIMEEKPSAKFGIPTQYYRHIFEASFSVRGTSDADSLTETSSDMYHILLEEGRVVCKSHPHSQHSSDLIIDEKIQELLKDIFMQHSDPEIFLLGSHDSPRMICMWNANLSDNDSFGPIFTAQ
eukprot:gnl/MRDRNA2_/MRDRNA2_78726_c0_seq1.p1 gnl/MRDRNA2_/MRDRNA2_78726_c0~~gnl/MRDRNA2_/MRDRNA2_78726_c0_seq1.p1  ORF type:complete len:1097 (+),score=130.06 gnl/MRDRNA2_/MRDRNA2_78726_c0_seq1:73-3363(+)